MIKELEIVLFLHLRQTSTDFAKNMLYNRIKEMVSMKEAFEKSLQMIKILNIKSEEEYNKLLHHYLLLSAESLKYIAQERDFNKIIGLA